MKKNLIKIALLLFVPFQIFASSYQWSASSNKESAYRDEAIYLSYVCEFSDTAEIYAVAFDPVKKSADVTIEMLSQTSRIVDSKKVLQYDFVAFVHKAGRHTFAFKAEMKKTTKDSIENTIIGRDNGKYAEYESKHITLEPLSVDVLETQSSLVGRLSLDIESSEAELEAYIPYHLKINIDGVGNLDTLEPMAFEIEGVKVFSEAPQKEFVLTPEGYKGRWSQKFAFVSEHDFTVEPFVLEYFDPKEQQKKVLRFEGVDVVVHESTISKESLLDDPEPKVSLFEWGYLYYLLSFVAGYLISKIEWRKKETKADESFCSRIKNTDSLEALTMVLVLHDSEKFKEIIESIEQKKITSLAKAKKLICASMEFH